jgi:hypothetical protein
MGRLSASTFRWSDGVGSGGIGAVAPDGPTASIDASCLWNAGGQSGPEVPRIAPQGKPARRRRALHHPSHGRPAVDGDRLGLTDAEVP